MAEGEEGFDTSRAELFEALGHPVRVKILYVLETRSMGFTELKREVGIESSGHLQFHLGKLTGLVATNQNGSYVITDEGREAIRVLKLAGSRAKTVPRVTRTFSLGKVPHPRTILAALLVVVIIVSGLGGYLLGSAKPVGQSASSQGIFGVSLPLALCSGSHLPPTNQSTIDVYQIRPLSVAVICVNYYFAQAGTANFDPAYGPFTTSGGVSRYTACGSANGTTTFRCLGLNVTASQYSFVHSTNENVTVAYTIVTGRNITGIYWFFIGSCYAIPIAFGPVPSSLTPMTIFGCVTSSSAPTSSTVTGYWNANVTAVRG